MNITGNDYLGKVVVYNSKSEYFDMSQNYTLAVNFKNNSTVDLPQHASFNAMTNQTIFSGIGQYDLPLFEINNIAFAPAK